MSEFSTMGLPEKLLTRIEAMGFKDPTPIQSHAIPYALQGRDVIGTGLDVDQIAHQFVFLKYITTDLPMTGSSPHSMARVSQGRLIRSHSRKRR